MKALTLTKNREGGSRSKELLGIIVPFLGLIFIIVFFQLTTGGKLLSSNNLKTFSNYAFQAIVPACGLLFLMSQGEMDFSMAGIVCISATFGAMVSKTSIPLAVLAMIASALVMGAINGAAHVFLRVPSFIATMAASFVYSGLASVLLGGGSITANYDFKNADTTFLKYGAILLIMLITYIVFQYSPFGKHCRAIGAKAEVPYQAGVNVKLTKFVPFLISALACAVVAVFALVRTCAAATITGSNTQVNAMLALLLGGVPFSGGWNSKFRSVIIGGLIMAVITNGLFLLNLSTANQQLIKGVIFIVAVAISFDRKNTAVIK